MKKIGLFLLLGFSLSWLVSACQERQQERRKEVPLDSIVLSDPCILADRKTAMYYMTGTGGMLWKSKDLKLWEGPFHVAKTDSGSWMGPKPMIWAAELHPYKGKYYYFATFTNQAVKIDTVQGNVIERRASHVLVSDNPDGPYVPMKDSTYLPADKPTLDGTFWVDKDGKPYMVYCYEWLQALDGTIEKIELKPDLSGTSDEGKILSQIFFKIPVYHQGKITDEKMCSYACVSMDKYRSCFKIRFHDAETFFNFPTPFTDF